MDLFNDAILAKQLWRLLKDDGSLIGRLLRAKYYLDGNLFAASLGPRPSFTWRCLMGARQVMLCGLRWLVGNGRKLNIWDDRRLLRRHLFKPITPRPTYGLISRLVTSLIKTRLPSAMT